MGDILSKLKMVSEKVGVTETAHTIEEQIDLISESLDKTPASTNIAEALDDLSEVAQNINNDELYIDKTITENGTYLPAADEATAYSKVVVDVPPPSNEFYPSVKTQSLVSHNSAGNKWLTKIWNGLTGFSGGSVWTDGDNIYYSSGSDQYVLDKSTSTWSTKTWNGLTGFDGAWVWTDGDNIYYSSGSDQYVLDKSTSTWSTKTWNNSPSSFIGKYVWTDGDNIYYSGGGSDQHVLDKSTSTWSTKTWSGLTSLQAENIWTDGVYIYSGSGYVLDKSTSTWSTKTWNNSPKSFIGKYVWTDGDNIYYSGGADQYVLDKSTSKWSTKYWNGIGNGIYAGSIWTDGDNLYCTSFSQSICLPITKKSFPRPSIKPQS